jgi:hypothetical protein
MEESSAPFSHLSVTHQHHQRHLSLSLPNRSELPSSSSSSSSSSSFFFFFLLLLLLILLPLRRTDRQKKREGRKEAARRRKKGKALTFPSPNFFSASPVH